MKKGKSLIFGGAAAGGVSGLFGGGGGMIAVPILQKAGKEGKSAHATALAVMFPVCLVGGLSLALQTGIPWDLLLPVALGNVFGGVVGAKALSRLPVKWISRIFYLLMFAVGVKGAFL